MSEKKQTKTNKRNWTSLQLKGFWATVIVLAVFWFGTFVGTQATLNAQANEASIKAQAVEEYKATLKQ